MAAGSIRQFLTGLRQFQAMFGYRMIFRSRWGALLWAAGILFTAWRLTPRADEMPGDAPSEPAHVNPWAKDAPDPE